MEYGVNTARTYPNKQNTKGLDQGFPANGLSDHGVIGGAEYGSDHYYYQQAILDYHQGSCSSQDYHNEFESGNFTSFDSPR
jgi:hypothetical protein